MLDHRSISADALGVLLAQSADAFLLVDTDERVVAVSTAAAHLLAAMPANLLGRPARALLQLSTSDHMPEPTPITLIEDGTPCRYLVRRTLFADGQGALWMIRPDPTAPIGRDDSPLRREQRLREVMMTIGSALNINQILHHVMRLALELTDGDAGSLPLYDHERDRLMPGYLLHITDETLRRPQYRGNGMIWELLDKGAPFLINDYPAQPNAIASLCRNGVHAIVGAPVRAGTQILGVIAVYRMREGMGFSQRDMEIIEALGRQAGTAIQNARLYEAALQESDRRHALYKASVEIGAALDSETLYTTIHRAAARLMACSAIAIAIFDQEKHEIDYVYMVDGNGRRPASRLPVERGLLGYVIRYGASLRILNSDPQLEDLFQAEPFGEGEDECHAVLATVMAAGDRVIGGITVQSQQPDAYSATDLSALEMLAATAAIAIQNAHLFAQVQQLATVDPLTGVPNRRSFYDAASREIDRCARYGHHLSVIMIDADHFKSVNDQYGHMAGDQVLSAIAARCQDNLREVDMVARYGGEEFVVLLPETSHPQALQVAERLRERIVSTPIPTDAGPVSVTISLGVASSAGPPTPPIDDLLELADRALYSAKAAGRDQVWGYLTGSTS